MEMLSVDELRDVHWEVSAAAARDIAALCAEAPGVETGGVLFGRGLEVAHACGPGPAAAASAVSLSWDGSYLLGYIDAASRLGQGAMLVLGRWHRHTNPDTRPSRVDMDGAEETRAALGLPFLVDLIVGTEADAPVTWAAFLCAPNTYAPLVVEVPCGGRYGPCSG